MVGPNFFGEEQKVGRSGRACEKLIEIAPACPPFPVFSHRLLIFPPASIVVT
jgi:hypothetical protein